MKIKNVVFIGILAFFIVFFTISNYSTKRKIDANNEKYKTIINKVQFWEYKNLIQDRIESQTFKNNWLQDTIAWKKYTDNVLFGNKLCYYYSEIHCNTCVDIELERLKKFAKKHGNANILVLVDYTEYKDFLIFKKINNIQFQAFKVNLQNMPKCIQELQYPCYFVLGRSLIPHLVFIPDKQDAESTFRYYSIVESML
jgi:hypothetical protein